MTELAAKHFGNVGLFDVEERGGLGLFEASALQDSVDLEDELRLDQVLFGVGDAEVLEDVSASDFVPILFHVSLSLEA